MSTANNTNEGNPVSFIVTGFGPFGTHVPDNPTTHLVQKITKYCEQQQITVIVSTNNPRSPSQEATNPSSISLASLITKTLVIETSAQAARYQIDDLYQQLCHSENNTKLILDDIEIAGNSHSTSNAAADAALTSSIPSTVILLHLGVHTKAKCFHLEQCAYNDATFRIPDQQGFQPQQECIIPQMSHGVSLLTPWNIPACLVTLNQTTTIKWEHTHATTEPSEESINVSTDDVPPHIAVPSTDPGRFVCNYLYCYSLATFCPTTTSVTFDHLNESSIPVDPALDATANESDRNGSNDVATDDKRRLPQGDVAAHGSVGRGKLTGRVYPLFLHVPPFSVVSEDEQLKFLAELMKCLYEQVA